MPIQFREPDTHHNFRDHQALIAFLGTTTPRPTPLTTAERASLTPRQREKYNDARTAYLADGLVIETPSLVAVRKEVSTIFRSNRHKHSGLGGLMISGAANAGKTTIAVALMKHVLHSYRKQFPEFADHNRIPIVYVDVPPGCTGKALIGAFARFFGLTVLRGEPMNTTLDRVVGAMKSAATQLVVVDEMQNLIATNRGNGESVDVLKALHNQTQATFVYCGIDLLRSPLLEGIRGRQISRRFTAIELPQFNLSNAEHMRLWRGIIVKFEKEMPLGEHQQGTILEIAKQLHKRSNGSIGELARIITGAALDVIWDNDGTETVTKEQILAQPVSIAAQLRGE